MSSPDIQSLLAVIENQLGWGQTGNWQGKDFEKLNELILNKTRVSLSASTLKRLWGRATYQHTPNLTTLDTLSQFAGYESWRSFLQQRIGQPNKESQPVRKHTSTFRNYRWWAISALIVSVMVLIGLAAVRMNKEPVVYVAGRPDPQFTCRPITRTLPNSVVFTYDAKSFKGDTVYIQQSWDVRSKVQVDPKLHAYTSVYYRPGVYHAKLIINQDVVKEKLLMIPTTGWLGLVGHQSVPVYLKQAEFIQHNLLQFPAWAIRRKNIQLEPEPPLTEYYNVGNFKPAPLNNFSFDVTLKNDYSNGAGACQPVKITLFTDSYPLIIQLSSPGCIAKLKLFDGSQYISGRTHDLSGFGCDFSQWVKLSVQSKAGKINYYINEKKAFESLIPPGYHGINGLGFAFLGTGSVKNIVLRSEKYIYFKAF